MDIDQLKAFVAVARTENFTRAAEQLNVVQSTVTARIKALEERLGKRLFERGTRHVSLTEAGRVFLPYAEKMVEIMREGATAIHQPPVYDDRIHIGGLNSVWSGTIHQEVLHYRNSAARISLRFVTGHSRDVVQWIREGWLDLGFVYIPPKEGFFEVVPLKQETMVLVGSPSFAERYRSVDGRKLLSLPYLHYDWGPPFREWFSKEIGPEELAAVRVDHSGLALKLLAEEHMIGFVLRELASEYIQQGRLKTIELAGVETPPPSRTVFLIFPKRRRPRPAVAGLIKHLLSGIAPERWTQI